MDRFLDNNPVKIMNIPLIGIAISLDARIFYTNMKTKQRRQYYHINTTEINRYKNKKAYQKFDSKKLYKYLLQNGFDEELINEYLEVNNTGNI